MQNRGKLGILLSFLLLGSVALTGQEPAPGPQQPTVVEAPSAANLGPNSIPKPVDTRSYEIGVNDMLRIEVWQTEALTRVVQVRPDGKFSMPQIGEVHAEGLTPERLEKQLEEALGNSIIDPDVTVSVLQVNSKSYKVTGEVNRPGTYPLITPVTVYDAILDAGGFREYANQKDIKIMRGSARIPFNATDFIKGKNLDKNILIQNGDIVLVHD